MADLIDSVSGTKQEGRIEGLSPPVGHPRDAPAREAAVGGEAGNIAPVAAAVASGVPESEAQVSVLCPALLQCIQKLGGLPKVFGL